MPTITLSGNDYDSYVSVADADVYLAADLQYAAIWSTLTTDQKGQALITATRALDELSWLGEKTSSSQALEWPRSSTGITTVDDDAVPSDIVSATSLYGVILSSDSTLLEQEASSNIKRIKAGSVELERFSRGPGPIVTKRVLDLVKPYLTSSAPRTITTSVTGNTSSRFGFDEFNLNWSY